MSTSEIYLYLLDIFIIFYYLLKENCELFRHIYSIFYLTNQYRASIFLIIIVHFLKYSFNIYNYKINMDYWLYLYLFYIFFLHTSIYYRKITNFPNIYSILYLSITYRASKFIIILVYNYSIYSILIVTI